MTNNIIETVDEICFVVLHSVIMVYTVEKEGYFTVPRTMRNNLGWFLIGLIVFILVTKCYMMLREEFLDMKATIKEYCKNRRKKNQRVVPASTLSSKKYEMKHPSSKYIGSFHHQSSFNNEHSESDDWKPETLTS